MSKSVEQRFWEKVEIRDFCECWEWKGYRLPGGYGRLFFRGQKNELAHRVAWLLTYGYMPTCFVLHKCDNPSCVNPNHLFTGTHRDNMEDMKHKGRARNSGMHGESHGSAKLTNDNVREIRRLLQEGQLFQREIAEQFGVARSLISLIKTGRAWKHLNEER